MRPQGHMGAGLNGKWEREPMNSTTRTGFSVWLLLLAAAAMMFVAACEDTVVVEEESQTVGQVPISCIGQPGELVANCTTAVGEVSGVGQEYFFRLNCCNSYVVTAGPADPNVDNPDLYVNNGPNQTTSGTINSSALPQGVAEHVLTSTGAPVTYYAYVWPAVSPARYGLHVAEDKPTGADGGPRGNPTNPAAPASVAADTHVSATIPPVGAHYFLTAAPISGPYVFKLTRGALPINAAANLGLSAFHVVGGSWQPILSGCDAFPVGVMEVCLSQLQAGEFYVIQVYESAGVGTEYNLSIQRPGMN